MTARRYEQQGAPAAEENRLGEIRPIDLVGLSVGPRGDEEVGTTRQFRDLGGQDTISPVEPTEFVRHLKAGQPLRQTFLG